MEKVFSLDQGDIELNVEDDDLDTDYSVFSNDDFAAADEEGISWGDL